MEILRENVIRNIEMHMGHSPLLDISQLKANARVRDLFIDPQLESYPDDRAAFRTDIFLNPSSLKFHTLVAATENYLISAGKGGGKTSLAYVLAYDVTVARGKSSAATLGVYLNYATLKPYGNPIHDCVQRFLQPQQTGLAAETLLKEGRITLVLDNFSLSSDRRMQVFRSFFDKYPTVRYIFVSDEIGLQELGISQLPKIGVPIKRAHVRGFGPNEVRSLLGRRYQPNDPRVNEHTTLCFKALRQMRALPSPLTITLLLQLFHDGKTLTFDNVGSLLETYITYYVERIHPDLTSHGQQRKRWMHFCGIFAEGLARKNSNSMKKSDLESLVVEYRRQFHFSQSVSDFQSAIMTTKIIEEFERDNEKFVRFTHSCFREFFGGARVARNKDFKKFCMEENKFLRFRHELVIAAGKLDEPSELLLLALNMVRKYSSAMEFQLTPELINCVMSDDVNADVEKALSEQLDALRDAEDVRSDVLDLSELNVDVLGGEVIAISTAEGPRLEASSEEAGRSVYGLQYLEALNLLGKLLRNAEFADAEVKQQAFDVLLAETTRLTVYMVVFIHMLFRMTGTQDAQKLSSEKPALETIGADVLPGRGNQASEAARGAQRRSSMVKTFIPASIMIDLSDNSASISSRATFESFLRSGHNDLAKLFCNTVAAWKWPDPFLKDVVRMCRGWNSAILARRIISLYFQMQIALEATDRRVEADFLESLAELRLMDNPPTTKEERQRRKNQYRAELKLGIEKLKLMSKSAGARF